jgi:hypothetical protein
VLPRGEHLYVYGYDERGKGIGKRRLTVARVPADKVDDFAAWRFGLTLRARTDGSGLA